MEGSRNKDLRSHLGIKVVSSHTEGRPQTNCEKLDIRPAFHQFQSFQSFKVLRGLHYRLSRAMRFFISFHFYIVNILSVVSGACRCRNI